LATLTAVATPPTVGRNVALWDPTASTLREYTISAVTGSGPYAIEVEGGFGFDPTGAYVSTGAERLKDYFDVLTKHYLGLGPGEKSDSPDVMPRARRYPAPDVIAPSDITSLALNALSSAHPAALGASYPLRVATGTSTALTSPGLPPTSADPPKRLRVKHLAIRKA